MSDTPAPGRGTDSPGTLEKTMNEQQQNESAGEQQQEPAQEQPAPSPDAVMEIRFNTETNALHMHFRYATEAVSHPAHHFASWLHRNHQALASMAAQEFNAVHEAVAFVRLPVLEKPPQAEDKPAVVESATTRLVSPHGGPLQ